MLLSPIVGEFSNEQTRTSFSPSFPLRFREAAEARRFRASACCEIHMGEEGWQSSPANVLELRQATGIPVTVVAGGGHDLGKDYVCVLFDR